MDISFILSSLYLEILNNNQDPSSKTKTFHPLNNLVDLDMQVLKLFATSAHLIWICRLWSH